MRKKHLFYIVSIVILILIVNLLYFMVFNKVENKSFEENYLDKKVRKENFEISDDFYGILNKIEKAPGGMWVFYVRYIEEKSSFSGECFDEFYDRDAAILDDYFETIEYCLKDYPESLTVEDLLSGAYTGKELRFISDKIDGRDRCYLCILKN